MVAAAEQREPATGEARWCAVVVNPAKADRAQVVDALAEAGEPAGWARPRVWETTRESTGEEQAAEAMGAGAAAVAVAGGDGTVRAVAGALAGTGVSLVVLSSGTGNLLARALELPLDDLAAAAALLGSGEVRGVDIVDVDARLADGTTRSETSVVASGLGLDAEVMGSTSEIVKRRVGWLAYVVALLRRLRGRGLRVSLGVVAPDDSGGLDPARTTDRTPVPRPGQRVRRVRSVMVASVGTLTGGMAMLPEAEIDDGVLEVVVTAPRGLTGWLGLGSRVLRGQGAEGRGVTVLRACRVDVLCPRGAEAQVDGDHVGEVVQLTATVRPRALQVLVPTRPGPG